jgi:hypothetical protein
MSDEFISLVQECTNKYYIKNLNDNETEICIKIPKRFKTLWLIKLSELKATEEEVEQYKDDDSIE